jgi:hypothetical protein
MWLKVNGMNQKALFGFVVLVALGFFSVGVYFLLQVFSVNDSVEVYGELPRDIEFERPDNDDFSNMANTVLIETATGNVTINNPLQVATVFSMSDGLYNLLPLETYTSRTFNVIYNENNQSFAVALLKEPLVEARYDAQQYMMQTLGVDAQDLCKLNAYVGVSFGVNELYSGLPLGFPGCQGSLPLE